MQQYLLIQQRLLRQHAAMKQVVDPARAHAKEDRPIHCLYHECGEA
jgi:hypothetical protein